MPRPDRFLAVFTLTGASICMLLFLATAAYGADKLLDPLPPLRWLEVLLAELALAAGAAAATRLWHANRQHAVTVPYLVLCAVGLVIGMAGAFFGFGHPVQDLAWRLGSEGRWSGLPFDENGNINDYIIGPETAPLFIFGPLLALIAWRGWRLVRRQRSLGRRLTSSGP